MRIGMAWMQLVEVSFKGARAVLRAAIMNAQRNLIQQIVRPECSEDARIILNTLGLSGLPSRESVHSQIEEKLLLPQEKLPDHWLPIYQVYETLQLINIA
jgi:hypothetical protein